MRKRKRESWKKIIRWQQQSMTMEIPLRDILLHLESFRICIVALWFSPIVFSPVSSSSHRLFLTFSFAHLLPFCSVVSSFSFSILLFIPCLFLNAMCSMRFRFVSQNSTVRPMYFTMPPHHQLQFHVENLLKKKFRWIFFSLFLSLECNNNNTVTALVTHTINQAYACNAMSVEKKCRSFCP